MSETEADVAERKLALLISDLVRHGVLSRCRVPNDCDCALCLLAAVADRNQPETIALRTEVKRLTAQLASTLLGAK